MTANLFYEIKGDGEPLILIPGFASGAWNWFRQTEDLALEFQVIAYDPRGIGNSRASDAELRELSMQTFVEDVLGILDELQIDTAHVLGASFGGFVAQEFAIAFPERLKKLILACTSYGGPHHVRPEAEILAAFAPDPQLSIGEKVRKFIRPAFTQKFNAEHADEVEKVCQMRERSQVADAVYLAQLQTAFTFNTEQGLGQIENETLIITGDADQVVPMQNSLNIFEKLPNAELKIIANGSHLFFIENAGEFNQAVREFLKN